MAKTETPQKDFIDAIEVQLFDLTDKEKRIAKRLYRKGYSVAEAIACLSSINDGEENQEELAELYPIRDNDHAGGFHFFTA